MNDAPGKPGIEPVWCAADKDLVITSLGNSRVWATLGHGIVNEVYWPSTGRPQLRDLGFIVAKGDKWWEIKRLRKYKVATPKPYILCPTVEHHVDDFCLTLDVICDDLRDVVLVRFNLQGEGCRLYAMLAPRLGSRGEHNSAWCDKGVFYGEGHGICLALRCDVGFARCSAGYAGESDGWQDFKQHSQMTWEYPQATDGNVAMIGELAAAQGVLALSFGTSRAGVNTLAVSSLAEGFVPIWDRVEANWEEWGSKWDFPAQLTQRRRSHVERSVAVLKASDDRLYPGAVVASLSIPWGTSRSSLGGYHYVWPRDSVETALSMIAVEHFREARQLAAYLIATQNADGHWAQNLFPSGEPFREGIQLDQTSFPIVLIAKLCELGELGDLNGADEVVQRAIAYLIRSGPVTPQDRWEENRGVSVFTLVVMITAIVAGADLIPDEQEDEREYVLSYADYLNRRIEDWLYVEGTKLDRKYGTSGHYIRMATDEIFGGQHGQLPIANHSDLSLPADEVVSMDFTYLSRMGLRRPEDRRMLDTLKVSEGELRGDTPNGPSFHRYTADGYGEHDDGSPFDGRGRGRLWPLLTGERGVLATQLGENPKVYLDALCHMTGPGGMLPEQVWDSDPIPERGLYPGRPSGSAMPLLWAQAEFVTLAVASVTGEPVELLDVVVKRYGFERPEPDTWHWRETRRFRSCRAASICLWKAVSRFACTWDLTTGRALTSGSLCRSVLAGTESASRDTSCRHEAR